MRRGLNRVVDTTGEAVAGDTLGDELLIAVLSNIEDKRERALLLAHLGLDLPLSALARTLESDRKALEETIGTILTRLRSDEDLVARLSNVRRAGRMEHYLGLVVKLDLQDWFCAHCRQFIAQPAVGRPRKTCSDACRQAFHRAGGTGWKDEAAGISGPYQRSNRPEDLREEIRRSSALQLTRQEADAMRGALRSMVRALDVALQLGRSSPDVRDRDNALILLGFNCPVQLSPDHLAALKMEDVIETPKGLEIVLHWGKRNVRQYITVPLDPDAVLCPVRAMRVWRARVRQSGRSRGRCSSGWGVESNSTEQPRLPSRQVIKVITDLRQSGVVTTQSL